MKHTVKERAIFALIDGRLHGPKRRALEKHLNQCDPCRTYYERVKSSRNVLRELGQSPLPPMDWRRVDATVNQVGRQRPPRNKSFLVPVAVAASALLALWWWSVPASAPPHAPVVAQGDQAPTPLEHEGPGTQANAEEAFVAFIAGQAVHDDSRGNWHPLHLEAPIAEGSRVRTEEAATAGLQLGRSHACRLEPDSTVELVELTTDKLEVGLEEGKVLCRGEPGATSLVLAVMDLVASASGGTLVSVEQRSRVIVIDLVEGTMQLRHHGMMRELSAPGRYVISHQPQRAWEPLWEAVPNESALAQGALRQWDARPEASLYLPRIDGVERVRVDGREFDAQPLALQHKEGVTRLEFLLANGMAIARDFHVGLGTTIFDANSVLPEVRHYLRPQEHRVARRMGTYNRNQVRALRSLVGQRVRRCYERALLRNPSIWGRIRVHFTVTTAGEARNVRVHNVTGGHRLVNECIGQVLIQERFPPPLGGYVPVEQNITLSPQF
jgi:hypothetical protein